MFLGANVSKAFILTGTMTLYIYLKECLKKKLIPHIREHLPEQDILSCKDMAICHYIKEVIDYVKSENIKIITENENMPNFS